MKFSADVEQWRDLVSQYFRPEDVDKALWVIRWESQGDPGAKGDGGHSLGLFQLDDAGGLGSGMSRASRLDPETNIKTAANAVYGGSGWHPWGEDSTYQGKPFGSLGAHPYPGNDISTYSQVSMPMPAPAPAPFPAPGPQGNDMNEEKDKIARETFHAKDYNSLSQAQKDAVDSLFEKQERAPSPSGMAPNAGPPQYNTAAGPETPHGITKTPEEVKAMPGYQVSDKGTVGTKNGPNGSYIMWSPLPNGLMEAGYFNNMDQWQPFTGELSSGPPPAQRAAGSGTSAGNSTGGNNQQSQIVRQPNEMEGADVMKLPGAVAKVSQTTGSRYIDTTIGPNGSHIQWYPQPDGLWLPLVHGVDANGKPVTQPYTGPIPGRPQQQTTPPPTATPPAGTLPPAGTPPPATNPPPVKEPPLTGPGTTRPWASPGTFAYNPFMVENANHQLPVPVVESRSGTLGQAGTPAINTPGGYSLNDPFEQARLAGELTHPLSNVGYANRPGEVFTGPGSIISAADRLNPMAHNGPPAGFITLADALRMGEGNLANIASGAMGVPPQQEQSQMPQAGSSGGGGDWYNPNSEFAGGGRLVLRAPAHVVDDRTGRPLASLAERRPEMMTDQGHGQVSIANHVPGTMRFDEGGDIVSDPYSTSGSTTPPPTSSQTPPNPYDYPAPSPPPSGTYSSPIPFDPYTNAIQGAPAPAPLPLPAPPPPNLDLSGFTANGFNVPILPTAPTSPQFDQYGQNPNILSEASKYGTDLQRYSQQIKDQLFGAPDIFNPQQQNINKQLGDIANQYQAALDLFNQTNTPEERLRIAQEQHLRDTYDPYATRNGVHFNDVLPGIGERVTGREFLAPGVRYSLLTPEQNLSRSNALINAEREPITLRQSLLNNMQGQYTDILNRASQYAQRQQQAFTDWWNFLAPQQSVPNPPQSQQQAPQQSTQTPYPRPPAGTTGLGTLARYG